MTTTAKTYKAVTTARFGGRAPQPTRYESPSTYGLGTGYSSHAPLDTIPHWDWKNPLNIIPFTVLAVVLLGVVGMLVH